VREILLLSVVSGVFALDSTVAWQVMLSQPLVASSAAGLLMGEPAVGVAIGIILQLLWSGSIPVGVRPMPDAPVASMSGVWFASTLLAHNAGLPESAACLAGVMVAFVVALVGRKSIVLERELNSRLFAGFKDALRRGRDVGPERVQLLSLLIGFSRGFLLCLAATALLAVVVGPAGEMVALSRDRSGAVLAVLGGLGMGVLFNTFVRKSGFRLAAFAAGVAFALAVRFASG